MSEPGNGLKTTKISVVIPVYRSEKTLPILLPRLMNVLEGLRRPYEIILVDDASPDQSWQVLKSFKKAHPEVIRIYHALVNAGQHNALICGFSRVTGDIVVTMDDDLQNPPEEVPKLLAAVERGYDLAIGAYENERQSAFRRRSGDLIDAVQRRIFHLPKTFQLTSFRAVRRPVIDLVNQMGGVFPYVTCMLLSNVSNYVNVPVRHEPRTIGHSNYTLQRSLALAGNLIFSYSSYPLWLVVFLCLASFLASFGYGSYILATTLLSGSSIPGWASLIVSFMFMNSLMLLVMLIALIYISRLYQQTTRTRITYAIEDLDD